MAKTGENHFFDPKIEEYVGFDVSKNYFMFSVGNRTYCFDRDTFDFDGLFTTYAQE